MKDNPPVLTSSWPTHLLIIFLLLLLAPIHMIPLFPHISTHVLGDVMDTAEYPLNEWWTAHALLDLKTNPFNNTYMFYPLGLNMVQHTYTFLDGLFYTLMRPFVPLIVFHNLLIWMTFFANALAAYLLIYYVTKTPWPAFIGALAFGHCPTLLSYYKTASLLEVYNLIFFIFFSYYSVQKRRLKWAVVASLFWGLTLYNYPYYFVFGGLWLVLLIGYQICPWEIQAKTPPELRMSLWAHGLIWGSLIGLILFSFFAPRHLWESLARRHLINWITLAGFGIILVMIWTTFKFQALRKILPASPSPREGLHKLPLWKIMTYFPVRWNPPPFRQILLLLGFSGITLGIAALVGFPYFQAYFKEEATRLAVGSNPIDFDIYSVDLVSFFAPFNAWLEGFYKIVAPDWKIGRPIVGTPAFLGYGFMIILLWGAGKFFKRPELRLWMIAWGGFLILSLGPYLKIHGLIFDSFPLPAYLIRYLPVFESTRTLSRYLAPVMLFLCLLVCLIIQPLYVRLSPWGKKIFISGMFIMVGFEYGLLPYPLPMRFSDYRVPDVYTVLSRKAGNQTGVLLDLPLFTHSGTRSAGHGETRRLFYQTVHKQKIIGGVSSKLDESVFVYFQNQPAISKLWSLQPVDQDELAALIYAFEIQWVVLDKRYYPLETLIAYRSLFDSAPYFKSFYEDSRYLGMAIDQNSVSLKEKALHYWGEPKNLYRLVYPEFTRPLKSNEPPPLELLVPQKLWNYLEIEIKPELAQTFSSLKLSFLDKKEIDIPLPSGYSRESQKPFQIRLRDILPLGTGLSSAIRVTLTPGRRRPEQTLGKFPFRIFLLSLGQASGFHLTPSQALIQDDHFFIDQRGITAFRISTQGKVLEKAYFDTHGSIQGTLDLVSWLKKFPGKEYLALVVHDEGSRALIPEVSDLIRTFGATNPLTKEDWRQSYCFLGKKGDSKEEAFESHTVSSPSVLHSPGQVIEISDIRLNLP